MLAAGETSGINAVAIGNPNRVPFEFDLGVSSRVNEPPMFSTVPIISAKVGEAYQYDADASDPENNPLSFSLAAAPAGMTIDSASGVIAWTPTEAQVGPNRVSLKVLDGQGGLASESFTIAVRPIT